MTGDPLPIHLNGNSLVNLNGNTGITINGNGSNWVYPGQCHGCSGRGWVETSDLKPHKCPVCEGKGKYTEPFSPIIQPNPWQPSPPMYPQYPWVYPWTTIISSSSHKSEGIPLISSSSVGKVTESNISTFTKHSTGL